MDEAARTSGPAVDGPRDPEEIREDIAATREELGDTVEALAARTDVKAHAEAKVEDVKQQVQAKRVPIAAIAAAVVAFVAWRVIAKRRNDG